MVFFTTAVIAFDTGVVWLLNCASTAFRYRQTHPLSPLIGDLSLPENQGKLREIGPNMERFGLLIDRLDYFVYRDFVEAMTKWIYDHSDDLQFSIDNGILWKEVLELADKSDFHYLKNWRGTVRARLYWQRDLEIVRAANKNSDVVVDYERLEETRKRLAELKAMR